MSRLGGSCSLRQGRSTVVENYQEDEDRAQTLEHIASDSNALRQPTQKDVPFRCATGPRLEGLA